MSNITATLLSNNSCASTIRVNFHEKVEAALNQQINLELQASYAYQSMAFYFNRHDVALPGFGKYFSENSLEEREHAEKLMKYQNMRGGRLLLSDISRPQKDEWGSGLSALEAAFDLEKKVTEAIYELLAVAIEHNDTHLADYLGEEFVDEQHEALKKLGDLISKCKRAGSGFGEYMFDMFDLQK